MKVTQEPTLLRQCACDVSDTCETKYAIVRRMAVHCIRIVLIKTPIPMSDVYEQLSTFVYSRSLSSRSLLSLVGSSTLSITPENARATLMKSTGRVRRYIARQKGAGKFPTVVYLSEEAKRFLKCAPKTVSQGALIEMTIEHAAADPMFIQRVFVPATQELAQ